MRLLKGLLLLLLGLLLLLEALLGAAWALTPSADDVQWRALEFAHVHSASPLMPDQVPSLLAEAVVATEDERFYVHHGLDSIGIARALLVDAWNRCACQGGSTLTQQLAKLLYLNGSDAGFNKVRGMALALKIEQQLSKAEILADYLSLVPTGPTRYGMPNAACAYFGRPLGELGLADLALLAGLPQAPSSYDPLVAPARALARRLEVLQAMRSDGYISAQQLRAAAATPYLRPAAARC